MRDPERWIILWKTIAELKLEVSTLLDARRNREEWELRDNRETADHMIREFFDAYYKEIASEDPDLFNDFLGVYDIREFAYHRSLAKLRKEDLDGVSAPLPPKDLTCQQAVERLKTLNDDIEAVLRGLVPAWTRFETTHDAKDVVPHKAALESAQTQVETIAKELDRFLWVKGVTDAYQLARDQHALLRGETTWLMHVVAKGESCI